MQSRSFKIILVSKLHSESFRMFSRVGALAFSSLSISNVIE